MKSLEGTLTEQNLLKAFAGESQARMRYDYFASQAKKKDWNKLQLYLLKLLLTKKNMQKDSLSFLKADQLK